MMLTFIFGGSASGKSEYAEQYAASLAHNCNAPLLSCHYVRKRYRKQTAH